MPVATSHPEPVALPAIDAALCTSCGECAAACPTQTLAFVDGRLLVNEHAPLGCIGCAHCMCICPTDAVRVSGRGVEAGQLAAQPPPGERASVEQLEALLAARRSMRSFASDPVPPEVLKRVLDAAALAPMGIPPSEVRVLVLQGRDKVRRFARDMDGCFRGARSFLKSPLMKPLKLMMKREEREQMDSFIIPLLDYLIDGRAMREDWLFYDAPLALLFYSSRYADPADAGIAATYAMLAAEALGLGTCLIGSVCPFLQRNPGLMEEYGLPRSARLGVVLIAGYPALTYRRAVRRPLAQVHYA